MLLLAACGSDGEAPPPVEVTRVVEVEVEVVVTATPEPTCNMGDVTMLQEPGEGLKWVFDPQACVWEKVEISSEPTAAPVPTPIVIDEATPAPEPVNPVLSEIVSSYPLALINQFGTDGRDLLLVTSQSNETPDNPLEPAAVYPIDEMKGTNTGRISFSTGYLFGTVGMINDGGPIFRFAGPWGGPESRANYTYMIVASNHTTDVGAYQFALDHYPSGSVAVSSGSPSQMQFAQNLWDAVNHTSGVNDPTQPNPIVGLFIVDAEEGTFRYLELTYFPMTGKWEWTRPVSGQLPLVEEWNNESVFDVLED